jgi:hypothetical protein
VHRRLEQGGAPTRLLDSLTDARQSLVAA